MRLPEANKQIGSWKALLISPSRGMRTELLPLLAQNLPLVPVYELDTYPTRSMLGDVVRERAVNLCFLDVVSDPERGLTLITDLLDVDPGMQVVILTAGKDIDLLRYLRTGAGEFLLSPFSSDQIQAVAGRLAKVNPQGPGRADQGRVICVVPAKGACGASTIACNLAFQWKRNSSKRVLLADLDPVTGTQGFLLKIKSAYSFVDAISQNVTLDADVWRVLVTSVTGVDVLLSPENPIETMHGAKDATALVEFTRQAYDIVVLDVHGAYDEWGLALARMCDDLILVATNELPALQAAQRVLSYFDHNRVDRSKIRLVINRYNREVGLSREMIETALQSEIFHLVPSDYDAVQNALIEGKLIPGNSSFGKSLASLATRLAGREEPSLSNSRQHSEGLGGLLSRLLHR